MNGSVTDVTDGSSMVKGQMLWKPKEGGMILEVLIKVQLSIFAKLTIIKVVMHGNLER